MHVEKSKLKNGDVLHFKHKGWTRFFKKFNPLKSGIFFSIKDVYLVATVIDGKVMFIDFKSFVKDFSYMSSSPNWKGSPFKEVLKRLWSDEYKNSDQFVGEIIGAKDFHSFKKGDVLRYCIDKEWLSE